MEDNYKSLKNNLDLDYILKTGEEKRFLKNHWSEFNNKVKYLESFVGSEFSEVIKKIGLNEAKIISFRVEYKPESKNFRIKITELHLINQKQTLEAVCASMQDKRLSPEIREFREKYNINYIACDVNGIKYSDNK